MNEIDTYFLNLGRNLSQFSFAKDGSFASSFFNMRIYIKERVSEWEIMHDSITDNTKNTLFTLIWKTGCSLFWMHSSTILLTCFKPLIEPMAATVFPYLQTNKKNHSAAPLHWETGEPGRDCITIKPTRKINYLNQNIAARQDFKCLQHNCEK